MSNSKFNTADDLRKWLAQGGLAHDTSTLQPAQGAARAMVEGVTKSVGATPEQRNIEAAYSYPMATAGTATQKDIERIQNIFRRANGENDRAYNYAHSMARAIKDSDKCWRRMAACEAIKYNAQPLARVFYRRWVELTGGCR